jgi:serine/threonine-protein kinase
VLPFENLSGDASQAYFAEGIVEELRAALTRIGLQVIGRTSSAAVKDLDTKAAASKLDVANVLTGSVRRSPQLVRISAQLISGRDGVQLWEQSFDRAPGDEIKIQTDIAASVAQALKIALGQAGQAVLRLGGTADSKAQDLFFRAASLYRNDMGKTALLQAIQLLNAAVARDPKYADALRLKASTLELLATSYSNADEMGKRLSEAELAAKQAIAAAPTLGAGYAKLALIREDRFDFVTAFRLVRQALALSPDDPNVISSAMYVTWYLGGNPRAALPFADRLVALDPLTSSSYSIRSVVLIDLREYEEAIRAARKSLELAPAREWPHQLIGDALLLINRPAEAAAEYKHVSQDDVFRLRGEAVILARSGNLAAMDKVIARIRSLFSDAASFQYAQIYAQARKNDEAFAALERGIELKDPGITGLRTDPFMDPIRSDPRYAALVKKLNFPAWT